MSVLLGAWPLVAWSVARFSSVTAAICDDSQVSRFGSRSWTCPISLRYIRTGSSASETPSSRVSSNSSLSTSSRSSSSGSNRNCPASDGSETTSMPISSSWSNMACASSPSGSSNSASTSDSSSCLSRWAFANKFSGVGDSSVVFLLGRFAIVFRRTAPPLSRLMLTLQLCHLAHRLIDEFDGNAIDVQPAVILGLRFRIGVLDEKIDVLVVAPETLFAQFQHLVYELKLRLNADGGGPLPFFSGCF